MKKKTGFLKKFIFVNLTIVAILLLSSVTYYFAVTHNASLDSKKLNQANATTLSFFDSNNNSVNINELKGNLQYVKYSDLQQHTIDAFVCVEDKRFFDHNGIDYIRILGAIKNNLTNPRHKQGGSTISQQVIKNTQLTSEKTITRKLKEFKLAKQLEKQCSKQEILEIYLNSIYFGNGCYGIGNASKFYFNKPASQLSVSQSALLASTINAPSVYDPVSNPEKAFERKNLILKLMLDNNKIDKSTYTQSKDAQILIEKAVSKYKNQYYKGVISEACKILCVTENQLKNMNLQIHTYYNAEIQNQLENQIINEKYTAYSTDAKLGSIVLDNKDNAVIAIASNSGINLLNTYRQPGSVIKPLLVYAPAFEKGKYSPASYICDEPVNINGYSPENANKNYYGMIDIKTCIAKSLNIPAVKVLDEIGINYAKTYAKKLGINFDNNDNNLALALGGFTKGTTIKQLADAYMCFANGGSFCSSAFIKQINSENSVIYKRQENKKTSINASTAYLINDCLKQTVIDGTAKRMKYLNLPLCAKTGTVGYNNGNTDAYNVCYTTNHTICTWIGSSSVSSPLPSSVNGATYPTLFNSAILENLYKNQKPNDFIIPNDIVEIGLNQEALTEYKLEKDDTSNIKNFFDSRYIPNQTTRSELDVDLIIDNFENCKPIIKFDAKRNIIYEICRIEDGVLQILSEIKYTNEYVNYTDATAVSGKLYEYYVVSKNQTTSKTSNSIKLIAN